MQHLRLSKIGLLFFLFYSFHLLNFNLIFITDNRGQLVCILWGKSEEKLPKPVFSSLLLRSSYRSQNNYVLEFGNSVKVYLHQSFISVWIRYHIRQCTLKLNLKVYN